jgi:transposase
VRNSTLSARWNKLPTTVEECHQVILEMNQLVRHVLERVEKLEHENRELRARLNSNSNNSSKPPSSDFKKPKKNKKPSSGKLSGGQKGHPGHYRELLAESEVDEIIECKTFHCCDFCAGEVIPKDDFIRHQVHELPDIQLEVREYRVAIGRCRGCTRKQLACLPDAMSWGITGPRLTSFMSMLVAKYQLSRRALKEFLEEHFHFCISLGTVFNKQKLVNRVLEEPVRALLPFIKQSQATNIDETSHRQEGQNHWLWTVASKNAAYFKVTKSRGKKVLKELMEDYEHTVISDRYSAYNYFDSSHRQICWAHLKRDFTRLWQKDDKLLSRIGKGLLQCESQLFKLWHQFKKLQITRDELLRQTAPIVRAVGEYLEQGTYTAPELKVAGFCKNLLERFSSLWLFLEREDVEPTNNHAERCLRFLVIWRKKYFGTQSNYGSEYVARTASLIATSKLQKINPFQYLSLAIKAQFSKQKIPTIITEPLHI